MGSLYSIKPEAVAVGEVADKPAILAALSGLFAKGWGLDPAALLKLRQPVDFASADGMPVDLVFGLLSPENSGATHLHALAAISRLVRDERVHEALSDAPNKEALYGLLTNATDRDAA